MPIIKYEPHKNKPICRHPEHNPPSHIHYPKPGVYYWKCPECGKVTKVLIPEVSLTSEVNIQFYLAQQAGKLSENRTWLDEYKYHVGMVEKPIPFERFRMMYNRLGRLLDTDAGNPAYDRQVNELCRELGY